MNTRLIVLILLSLASTAAAQQVTADYLPLAVGNEWVYQYLAVDDDIFNQSAVADSGRASYTIIMQNVTPDSIVWGVREIRDIVRKSYSYWQGLTVFWRVPIKDSVLFSMVEYLDGNHRMVRSGKAEDYWRSVFCVVAQTSDTTRVFRYIPDTESDTVQFTAWWRRWETPTALTDAVTWILQRGVGIRLIEYSTPGITGGAYRTRHRLQSQTVLSARPIALALGPNEFSLDNNYPNPFNPRTVLSFSLGSRERVTVTIVDILGRPIATLFDDIVQAGKHSVVWDASREASGTYFCVAKTARSTRCLALLLLK